jgi:hypothetical protein
VNKSAGYDTHFFVVYSAGMLTHDAIIQFQKLYATAYGVELSDGEAAATAEAYLKLYKAVLL